MTRRVWGQPFCCLEVVLLESIAKPFAALDLQRMVVVVCCRILVRLSRHQNLIFFHRLRRSLLVVVRDGF